MQGCLYAFWCEGNLSQADADRVEDCVGDGGRDWPLRALADTEIGQSWPVEQDGFDARRIVETQNWVTVPIDARSLRKT